MKTLNLCNVTLDSILDLLVEAFVENIHETLFRH